MSVFGVRKEISDVNTPKTSISASADKVLLIHDCNASGVFNMIIKVLLIHDCNASGVFNMINKVLLIHDCNASGVFNMIFKVLLIHDCFYNTLRAFLSFFFFCL